MTYPRFAPVMPLFVADRIRNCSREAFGDYHLLLAHDVVANPKQYNRIYSRVVQPGGDGIVIMDNSVVELGEPVTTEIMQQAVEATNANVVVLPDFLLDRRKTIEAVKRGIDEYGTILNPEREAMAIPQGNSIGDWLDCLEQIFNLDGSDKISWIGVPKNLNEKLEMSRGLALSYVLKLYPGKKCHLFGFSNDLNDDIRSARLGLKYPDIKGIDSAAPVWSGWRDLRNVTIWNNIPGRRGNWFEHPVDYQGPPVSYSTQVAADNILTIRRWLKE